MNTQLEFESLKDLEVTQIGRTNARALGVKHESEYDVADARNYNPELRASIEAQIANVADELAYTAPDLDKVCVRG